MNKSIRFIKTALTYFFGNILSKLITFFLLPLYTTQIVPEQYGNYDLTMTLITLFVSVGFFQIWDGMFRFSFDYKESRDKYKIVADSFVVFGFGIVVYTTIFMISNQFLKFEYWQYGLIYGIIFGLQNIYSFMARVFIRNQLFVFSGTSNTLVVAIANIIFILGFKWDVKSLYIAQILGCVVQIMIIELHLRPLRHFSRTTVDKNEIIAMLKFSVPLCVSTISYWLLAGFTKLIINEELGAYENGIYATANTLANTAIIAVNIFQFAWNEMAYISAQDSDRRNLYKRAIMILSLTVTFGYAILCLIVKCFFGVMIGKSYWEAKEIIPLLMIGVAANAVAGFLGTMFMTEKKTGFILSSTFIAAGVNIILAKLVTQKAGLVGSVIVLSGAFILLMVVRLFQLHKYLHVSIGLKPVISVLPVMISFVLYNRIDNKIALFAFSVLFGVLYLVITIQALGIDPKTIINRKRNT